MSAVLEGTSYDVIGGSCSCKWSQFYSCMLISSWYFCQICRMTTCWKKLVVHRQKKPKTPHQKKHILIVHSVEVNMGFGYSKESCKKLDGLLWLPFLQCLWQYMSRRRASVLLQVGLKTAVLQTSLGVVNLCNSKCLKLCRLLRPHKPQIMLCTGHFPKAYGKDRGTNQLP